MLPPNAHLTEVEAKRRHVFKQEMWICRCSTYLLAYLLTYLRLQAGDVDLPVLVYMCMCHVHAHVDLQALELWGDVDLQALELWGDVDLPVCTCTCMHMWICRHSDSRVVATPEHHFIHTCMHAYTHTHIRTYTHTYMRAGTQTRGSWRHPSTTSCIHACMHTHIHTYIHTYIHACRYSDSGVVATPEHHFDVWIAALYVALVQVWESLGRH